MFKRIKRAANKGVGSIGKSIGSAIQAPIKVGSGALGGARPGVTKPSLLSQAQPVARQEEEGYATPAVKQPNPNRLSAFQRLALAYKR